MAEHCARVRRNGAGLCALGLLAAALGCGVPRERSRHNSSKMEAGPRAAAELRYTVTLADDLFRADVVVCSDARAPFTLRPGRDDAGARLLYARQVTPTPVRKLVTHGGVIEVPAGESERCVGYGVHLGDGGRLASLVRHTDDGLVSSVNAWLWRPDERSADIHAELRFVMPAGIQAFPPYPQARDGSYTLDARAFRFDAYVAFGRARQRRFEHAGLSVNTVTLADAVAEVDLEAWLTHHLDALAPLTAAFPSRELVVLALPSPADAQPFGCVTRGGIPSVLVFVPHGSDLRALRENWVLSHELSHFALPFVRREDAWASEGFATYFQEVLRSRARQRSAHAVAEDLYRTFERVEREVGSTSLAAESQGMERSGHYHGVYWGGAAVYLALDVALREADDSYDLTAIVARIAATRAVDGLWSAADLMLAIDRTIGRSIAVPLSTSAIARPFPDFRAAFAALGITDAHGELHFDDGARRLRAHIFGAD